VPVRSIARHLGLYAGQPIAALNAGLKDELLKVETMSDPYSLREVFRQYLEEEILSRPVSLIAKLITSGELSRTTLDDLLETEDLAESPHIKEIFLDLILVFARKCVEDHHLSETEIDELGKLITVFRIEEGEFFTLRPTAVQEIISAQATRILEDRYVTEPEEISQTHIQRLFGLGYDEYLNFLRPSVRIRIEELESRRLITEDLEELRLIDSSIQNLRSVALITQ